MRKILVMTISLSFLSACQTDKPLIFEAKQCQTVLSFDDAGNVIPEKSFCRFRPYTISRDFIGSRGNVTRRPLGDCGGCLGYSVRDNARLVNFYESVRSEINAAEEELEKGIAGETEEHLRTGEAGWQHDSSAVDTINHKED